MATSNLISRKDAAEYLGVSPQTLAIWASTKRNSLPYAKIGRLAKYRKDDLEAFVAKNIISSGVLQ